MSSTSFITETTYPLGLRQNNPGNIRPSNIQWEGMLEPANGYCVFVDVEHGIRAMAKDLHTKIAIDGLNEIALYVPRYAPAADNNDTQAYINTVSEYSGFAPNAILTADEPTLLKLIPAHIRVEVGEPDCNLITQDMINTGVAMAF